MKKLSLRKKNRVLWALLLAIGVVAVGAKVDAELSLRDQVAKETAKELGSILGLSILQDKAMADEVFGAQRQSGGASTFTNLTMQGARIQCNGPTSTRCTFHMEEVQRFPFTTTTLVLENPLSVTSTLSVKFMPRSSTSASSTFNIFCFASSSQHVAYNMNLASSTQYTLLSGFTINTSTAPYIDSYNTSTGAVFVSGSQDGICVMQHNSADRICTQAGQTNGCEAPTSSNRGLDYDVIGIWDAVVTSTDLVSF